MRRRSLAAFVVLAIGTLALAAACSGGDSDPTPTLTSESSAAPIPTQTPTPEPYRPPHDRPGPASDVLRYRAFHTDVASAAIRAGDADLYEFSLKTEAARALEAEESVRLYRAPASTVSLVLNPAPAPEGELNPLSIREVRFALQYAINRDFIANEIYKGLAIPMLAHVGELDYDYQTVFSTIKGLSLDYDPERAKLLVTHAMEDAGAELRDGVWHFNDRPIRLKFIIRTEDERREIGDLIRAELETLGFQILPTYHQFAPAIIKVYSTDPQLFEWHLYTEGWGRGAAQRFDASTLNQMCAPWLGNMPGWQEVGFWQYEHARLDEVGQRIFQGSFSGQAERDALYVEATRLCVEESVRFWLATVQNTFPAVSDLAGVTEDVVAGPKALWTLREAYVPGQDTLTVGHLWVWTERTTWNPIGGFGDVYSTDIWRNVYDPPLANDPFTGDPVPFRAEFEVETAGPEGRLDVPPDAVAWDAEAGAFVAVGSGVTSTSKVTFDYSRYFSSTWHHGEPITMADVIYSIYQQFDIAFQEDKAKIERAIAVTSQPYLDTFQAVRVLDDNRLEVYVDFWHFVEDYIASYASPSGLAMPWEVLAAMDRLVFEERRAAYSDTAAGRFNVPWINLVMPRDARLVRNALRDMADAGEVPLGALSVGGDSLVSTEDALARYEAASAWFDEHRLMVISNGPYRLTTYDPAAQFAEMEAVRDATYPFKPGDWYRGKPGELAVTVAGPVSVVAGEATDVTVDVSGPGDLALRFVFMDLAEGAVVLEGEATAEGAGRFRIAFSAAETRALQPGLHQLAVLASSDALALPVERRLNVDVRSP